MRAAVLHELRTVPVFGDFEEPQPDDVHQVAEVLLGALNPVDLFIAAGEYGDVELPYVVGREGIARLSDGAVVYFSGPPAPFGSLAQFAPVTLERLRERGADATVVLEGDYRQALKDAAGDGCDVVLDPLYGPPLEAALSATAQGARVVSIGASAAESAAIPFRDIFGRTLTGHSNGHASLEVRREAYERLAAHAVAGEIEVEVERLPLSRIADAWELQARGPHRKITLVP
jgi:NADPH:quinone reductase-like Zn-dependent oxidoreductase